MTTSSPGRPRRGVVLSSHKVRRKARSDPEGRPAQDAAEPIPNYLEWPPPAAAETPISEPAKSAISEPVELPTSETLGALLTPLEWPPSETAERPQSEAAERPIPEAEETPIPDAEVTPILETAASETAKQPFPETWEPRILETAEQPVPETAEPAIPEREEPSIPETAERQIPGTTEPPVSETAGRQIPAPPDQPTSETTAQPAPEPPPGPAPIAYVLLWFPLSSETFLFREVVELLGLGLPIQVYAMYGKALKGCSEQMRNFSGHVENMGSKATLRILLAFFRALALRPGTVLPLIREGLLRRLRNLESFGENFWCFLAGFLLAERCKADRVRLIHSGWANGPATAAWIASRLTGIPFAFTGRAGDIYPEDGLLREKSRDATFIRANNMANVHYLRGFCPEGEEGKVHLVYNGLTFPLQQARVPVHNDPYRLLAVGRFARTKGFPDLLTALARLRRESVPVRLTLVGDGMWRWRIHGMIRRLDLKDMVDLPGFVPHDRIRAYMRDHDLLVVPSVVHTNGDRDGIPNVIMEALSSGLPVVATDVCGISEVVRNGETGLLVPQRNPPALANAIRYMLEHGDQASRMAEAGKALVERMFDAKANIAALRDLYIEELAKREERLHEREERLHGRKGRLPGQVDAPDPGSPLPQARPPSDGTAPDV
jgi:glycosyltransferase involved in cell wall biosynthesis